MKYCVYKHYNIYIDTCNVGKVEVGFSDPETPSDLEMISYSKELTVQSVGIIRSNDKSCCEKIWTLFRLLNNLMNTEVFFFADLAIILAFSVYNVFASSNLSDAFGGFTFGIHVICTFIS